VTLGEREDLLTHDVQATHIRIRDIDWLKESPEVQARIRYKSPVTTGHLTIDNDQVLVHFSEPVWGVAPGQSLVIYKDGLVVGGGIIS
jgi:tRNA-specific 2-thiouridylase